MSRTLKAIERHMTPPSKRKPLSLTLRNSSANGNSADRKHCQDILRKLRLAFAPSQSTKLATVNR